jgi:hypothetical protein
VVGQSYLRARTVRAGPYSVRVPDFLRDLFENRLDTGLEIPPHINKEVRLIGRTTIKSTKPIYLISLVLSMH